MDSLPTELLYNIMRFVTIQDLRFALQLVSKSWNEIARKVLDHKLISQTEYLNSTGAESSKFKVWLLANFDHPYESRVVTGIEFELVGHNVATGSLKFAPTFSGSFGICVDELGYVPFTKPYPITKFSYLEEFVPKFRLWLPPNSKGRLIRQNNVEMFITDNIKSSPGFHLLSIQDTNPAGQIIYEIENGRNNDSAECWSNILNESVSMMLDEEKSKVVGKISMMLLDPRTILN